MSDRDRGRRGLAPNHYNWMGGVVLILLGCVFFLQNAGVRILNDNWWALFILIPSGGLLIGAWNMYRAHGRFTRAVAGMVTGALAPLAVALIFLFNLDWGTVWPVFLIVAGAGALLQTATRDHAET
jgi:hypothetical protein